MPASWIFHWEEVTLARALYLSEQCNVKTINPHKISVFPLTLCKGKKGLRNPQQSCIEKREVGYLAATPTSSGIKFHFFSYTLREKVKYSSIRLIKCSVGAKPLCFRHNSFSSTDPSKDPFWLLLSTSLLSLKKILIKIVLLLLFRLFYLICIGYCFGLSYIPNILFNH